jgi:hypothetical protein
VNEDGKEADSAQAPLPVCSHGYSGPQPNRNRIEPAILHALQKIPYTYESHYHESMVIFFDRLVMTEQDSLLSLNMDSV